jgi:hypothetical protein
VTSERSGGKRQAPVPAPPSHLRRTKIAVRQGTKESTIRFPTPEADADYAVLVTPSWLTPFCASAKTPQGFTLQFGAAAPANARVDWMIVR